MFQKTFQAFLSFVLFFFLFDWKTSFSSSFCFFFFIILSVSSFFLTSFQYFQCSLLSVYLLFLSSLSLHIISLSASLLSSFSVVLLSFLFYWLYATFFTLLRDVAQFHFSFVLSLLSYLLNLISIPFSLSPFSLYFIFFISPFISPYLLFSLLSFSFIHFLLHFLLHSLSTSFNSLHLTLQFFQFSSVCVLEMSQFLLWCMHVLGTYKTILFLSCIYNAHERKMLECVHQYTHAKLFFVAQDVFAVWHISCIISSCDMYQSLYIYTILNCAFFQTLHYLLVKSLICQNVMEDAVILALNYFTKY